MAAKRIAKSAINWAGLAEKVPEHQKTMFTSFKTKHDQYVRRVLAYPEQPPAIDWAFYKSKVPIAGMVDEFQKKYSDLSIPYPPNKVTSELDSLEKEVKSDIEKFKQESNARIVAHKQQLAHLASLLPFDQMTMEDVRDAYPDEALDPINRPTFWPHTPEEQVGYYDKEDEEKKH